MTPWHELLAQAINDYGDTPGTTLEQHLIEAYAEHPSAVEVAITKITQAYKAGRINSPWGAVKAETDKQLAVRRNLPATNNRQIGERNSEQWIRTAGMHFDRWDEIHDELFGSRGKLKEWDRDTGLETRLRKLWDEYRPLGEQLEHEELERANKWHRTPEMTA